MKIIKYEDTNINLCRELKSSTKDNDLHIIYWINDLGAKFFQEAFIVGVPDFDIIRKEIHKYILPNEYTTISFKISRGCFCDNLENPRFETLEVYSVTLNQKHKTFHVDKTNSIIIDNGDYKNCYLELEDINNLLK